MYNILLVEDDSQIQEVIEDFFTSKSNGEFVIHTACDGQTALELIYENEFDLCLLDIMLPGVNGFEICRQVREHSIVPIIFITARSREEDILHGYELGCDDYVVKPFMIAELYAKVYSLLKRSKGLVISKELICGNITLNPATFTVYVNSILVALPPKQYALLKYMMENKNIVLSRDQILTRIWGYDFDGDIRVVDNHIKKLRHSLGSAGIRIKTIITKGYKITE